MTRIRRFAPAVLTCGLLVYGLGRADVFELSDRPTGSRLSQAIISYGFLRSNYPELDEVLKLHANSSMARELKALEEALDSLHCDLPTRLTFSHGVSALDLFVPGQWVESKQVGATGPEQAWLFVAQLRQSNPKGVLIILSSVAPERTTVFWLAEGFIARLIYDSFHKSGISNEPATRVGAIVGVGLEKEGHILLKEWSEPGSRGKVTGYIGRVFQIELSRDRVTLKNRGTLPQR